VPHRQRQASLFRAALALCALALALAHATAWAQPASDLKDARRHWKELDFELTVQACDRALAGKPTKSDKVESLRLKGSALIVLERRDEAVKSFEMIFALDPDYELPPDTSPRIAEVFGPAKATWQVRVRERLATELGEAYGALKMSVRAALQAVGGKPFPIRVELEDPGKIVSKVVVSYRRKGQRSTSSVSARPQGGGVTITIPAAVTAASSDYELEYSVRALHRAGAQLKQSGSRASPLVVRFSAGEVPQPTPITKKWWFWAGVGVAVISTGFLIRAASDAGPQTPRFEEL